MSQQQTPYYESDLDQQIGSLLEAWTCRDTGEHCRFCADVRVGDVPPDEQFCSEECEERPLNSSLRPARRSANETWQSGAMTERDVAYRVEPVDSVSDGEYFRLIAEYNGRFARGESPRHIERLSMAQAQTLRDSLNEQLGDNGPRRWADGDGDDAVQCPVCGATWVATTLYKTGDVLRCPGCDGVMRP